MTKRLYLLLFLLFIIFTFTFEMPLDETKTNSNDNNTNEDSELLKSFLEYLRIKSHLREKSKYDESQDLVKNINCKNKFKIILSLICLI